MVRDLPSASLVSQGCRCALADQVPLEFRQAREHRQEQPADGARRVDGAPGEADDMQPDAFPVPAFESRQGVRWRFWRIYNDIYVSAFETILFIEKSFGTQLRDHAVQISKERYALRQEIVRSGFVSAHTLRNGSDSKSDDARAKGG